MPTLRIDEVLLDQELPTGIGSRESPAEGDRGDEADGGDRGVQGDEGVISALPSPPSPSSPVPTPYSLFLTLWGNLV